MNPVLKTLLAQIGALNKNKQKGKEKPHKLILLQAVLDLINDGRLSENEIHFDAMLVAQFKTRFVKGSSSEDWEQPTLPFFHLRTSGFWEHRIIEGRELSYSTLTTSGGGTRRIFENIQYAYFLPEVFTLLLDVQARNVVQNFIQTQIDAGAVASTITAAPKLGTAFHESFKISRAGLAQILTASSETSGQGGKSNAQSLKSNTSLGNNQVKSSRRFARGVGLIDEKEYPTVFGNLCIEFDQALSRHETQWVMHYNMAAPWKSGPLYWNHLFCEVLTPDLLVTTDFLVSQVEAFLTEGGTNSLAANTYKTAVSVLVGSYTDDDALGGLKLLQATATNTYQVQDPALPTPATFACLLADYWEHNYPGRADVLLAELTAGPLARLLLAEGRLGPLLGQVEKLGLVRVQRRVPPYQVFRLWDSPADVWQKHLYPTNA